MMDYKKVNQALAKQFGTGQVEVRKSAKGVPWPYVLWFASDEPTPDGIEKAKEIVNQFEPTRWLDELAYHSE